MAALVITNAALVRLIWTLNGTQYAVNVMGALNTGPATFNQALANSLGAAIKSSFTSSGWGARVSSDVALAAVGVRNIDQANQAEFVDNGVAVAGTGATDPLPPQTALVITLRTALAGPSFRGRIYLPGACEGESDTNGTCTAAAAANAASWVNTIASNMLANGLTMAVLSRPRAAATIPAKTITAKGGFATAVNAIVNRDLVWDTQRRRAAAGI